MARMLWIATLSVALASPADAVKASAAQPLESLAVVLRPGFETRG
jgi:hypothetical protein